MKRTLVVAGVLALSLGTAGAAIAEPIDEEKFKGGDETSFSGSCEIEGRVLYPDEKLKDDRQDLTADIQADGECTGELDGNQETFDVKFRAYKREESFSCSPGDTFDNLPGELNPEPSAGEDEDNNIAVEFSTPPNPVTTMMLEGRNGGEAEGPYMLKDNPDPAELVVNCAGDGNEIVEFEATLDTGPGEIRG